MDSISSLGMSLLKRVKVLSIFRFFALSTPCLTLFSIHIRSPRLTGFGRDNCLRMVSSVAKYAMLWHFCSYKRYLKFVCACRTYCETDIDPAHRKLSQLHAVVRYLTGKEPDMQCKKKESQTNSWSTALPWTSNALYIRFPFLLFQKVMRCCCSKLFLMPWSQLLWKLTGPHSCSTHRGEYQHRAKICIHFTYIYMKKTIYMYLYVLSLYVAVWQKEWKQHSWGLVQGWWESRDTRGLRKELSSEWKQHPCLYLEYCCIRISKSVCSESASWKTLQAKVTIIGNCG